MENILHVDELSFSKLYVALWNIVQKTKANIVTFVKSPVIVIHALLPRCLPSVKRKIGHPKHSKLVEYNYSKAAMLLVYLTPYKVSGKTNCGPTHLKCTLLWVLENKTLVVRLQRPLITSHSGN